ncbi:MAG: hypothetical protein GXY83_06385 [Rhodopirellula sp.]|nr:hypothetical protein [Rhodopirellula sp.]
MHRVFCVVSPERSPVVCAVYALLFSMHSLSVSAAADDQPAGVHAIPYKPDPPPAIDGRLDEWEAVPNGLLLADKQHATYVPQRWRSPADLSARVWCAWRDEYLYLAADVVDDQHRQHGRGDEILRGDHVEIYLDLTPSVDPDRKQLGAGQVLVGLSPGALLQSGDPLTDSPAEAIVFRPEGPAASGTLVASQKTEKGYAIEAAVPWSLLGELADNQALRPAIGLAFGLELAVSDNDSPEPAQEKMMTALTAPWQQSRDRMLPAVLAAADGKASPVVVRPDLVEAITLGPGKREEISFAGVQPPPGNEVVLALKARIESDKAAGYTQALRIQVNGTPLDAERLVNWSAEETRVDGKSMRPAAGNVFNVPYAPDFDAPNRSPSYALRSGPKLCRYELRVTDLVKLADNVLVLENAAPVEFGRVVLIGDVGLQTQPPPEKRQKRAAPTGPLPVFSPATKREVDYALRQPSAAEIVVRIGPHDFRVVSEFSTPEPGWVQGPCRWFDFRREIQRRGESIVVRDTFTNRTDEKLALMQRHRALAPEPLEKVWLAGISPSNLASSVSEPANPTSYGVTGKLGIGLVALDDVSQVHAVNFSAEDHVGLADNQLVLLPKATHVTEWAILPTNSPDYFQFINAVRRLRGVNFTIPGSFAFLRANPRTEVHDWTDRQLIDFIGFKNAYFVTGSIGWPRYQGRIPHGTAFQTLDLSYQKQQWQRLRKLAPDVKQMMYYHCFLDVRDESPAEYRDARLLRVDGTQADYGKPHDRIFVPTGENRYGRDVAKNVEIILSPQPEGLGCDGVYWDELEYSRYQYHYGDFDRPGGLPWDKVTADINPKTHQIVRLKSSVTLLSQPFRLSLAKRILQDRFLVANGQPHTRAFVDLHFPRFVETGSISNCAKAQAYSPIALGDHLTERSEEDAYRVMLRALDFGCLYYWYNDLTVIPTHPTLTRDMFPITPLELHEGFVIGEERIVTKRSGLFGWNDRSRHEVHVFDDQGREVLDFKAPSVDRNGSTFTELRLPEDYSAAIVR